MTAITTTTDGEILVVEFLDSKLLDSQQIDQIGRELLGVVSLATDKKLFLSFKGVSFMSSAMVNKLVMLDKECTRRKVKLKFSHVGPNVMQVFDITGLFREDGPLGPPEPNSTKSPTASTSFQRPEKTPDTNPKDT